MKRIFLLLISLTMLLTLQANLLYDITDGKYRPKRPDMPVSMNDGEHYTMMTDDQTIVKFSYRTGNVVDTLFSIKNSKNPPLQSISGYQLSPKESKIIVYHQVERRYRRSFTAQYYIYDIKFREFDPLSLQAVPQEAPVFSPDDRYIAFGHKNNLYMKKVDFKTDIQITKDGAPGKIINGIADWVYEEEFAATHFYEWCPDSKLLAYLKFDESEVREFSFQTFNNKQSKEGFLLYPEFERFKYPKAGEKNAKVSVHIYDDFNKTTRHIQLNERDGDYYIPRIKWTNNAEQLAIFQLNRHQNRLDMLIANPKTGISRLLLRQEDKHYVDYGYLDFLRFASDNRSFYMLNDRDGFAHIYQYRMDGTIARQITKGNFDVTDFYGVDEARNIIYYQSAEPSPMQRTVFAIDARGRKTSLSDLKGTNRASFSKNFNYYVLDASNLSTPNKITLRNIRGNVLRQLEMNTELAGEFAMVGANQKEFFTFETEGKVVLNGWLLKPANFDPNRSYPLMMLQYSGPGSQQVLDQWSIGWEYYLSSNGYIVACVDGRGTGARGAAFLKSTYQQMGVLEARDQVAAARFLGRQNYVDAARIGIFGWSYGGSTVLWSMSTGDPVFKAGISVAPVTDWRFYDTAYTERFMRTPQENFAGYSKTSALEQASQLNGRLLLIHGTADDNVHYQNTLIYADKLVEAGKQFEMQIYTDKNHGITGKQTRRHLYTRMVDFLNIHL